jgi:hypothetical protein
MTSRVIANLALASTSGREITWGCMAVMLALNLRSGNKCVASPQADTVLIKNYQTFLIYD